MCCEGSTCRVACALCMTHLSNILTFNPGTLLLSCSSQFGRLEIRPIDHWQCCGPLATHARRLSGAATAHGMYYIRARAQYPPGAASVRFAFGVLDCEGSEGAGRSARLCMRAASNTCGLGGSAWGRSLYPHSVRCLMYACLYGHALSMVLASIISDRGSSLGPLASGKGGGLCQSTVSCFTSGIRCHSARLIGRCSDAAARQSTISGAAAICCCCCVSWCSSAVAAACCCCCPHPCSGGTAGAVVRARSAARRLLRSRLFSARLDSSPAA